MTLYCTQGHDNPTDNRFCRLCGESLIAAPEQLGGEVLALRYRIVRELGHGGFGRTYLAADTNRFSESCVLKEFAPQVEGTQALQKAEELFAREAGVLYQLQHPQIPRFRELFRAEVQGRGRLFLVQDYVEGQTYEEILRSRQQQGQRFNEPEILQLLHHLLPVLTYIHATGMVHRDISPDNLILRSSDGLPVLIDFGGVKQIAAAVASQVIHTPTSGNVTRLGKVGYAPPEQMDTGEAFPHSDLYALAVTVLVLLTGKEPQELLKDDRRYWQSLVKLNRSLINTLDRMLSPYPDKRYPSAAEVLRALGNPPQSIAQSIALSPAPANNRGSDYANTGYANTIAISPAAPATPPRPIQPRPTPDPAIAAVPSKPRDLSWLVLLVVLGLTAGSVYGVFMVNRMTIQPFWKWKPAPTASKPASSNSAADPEFSKAEQERKQSIIDRRSQLGIDEGFLINLVDEAFFVKHPIARSLSKGAADEGLRADWDKLANQLLTSLETLSPEARSRLGNYGEADLDKRRAAVNQINLSGRALNDLADARFYALFPDVLPDKLLQRSIGQVWHAIATDQVKLLQSGSTLEQIQFSPGSTNKQVGGTLKPGGGKAYLASLSQAQLLQVKLQAPKKLSLSIYPPASKATPLLEDSAATEWSGKLNNSGLYEIVVASNRSDSVNYTIGLTATYP